MNVFQLFKMVFSLVAAALILYFLLYYAGVYSGMQGESIKAKILKNFETDVNNVYSSGISVGFTDFSMSDFNLYFDPNEPEGIRSSLGKKEISAPLFFSPGDSVFIERGYLDMGWWRFHFVTATPPKRVIFNPLDSSPGTWRLLQDLVSIFPSTENSDIKLRFGLCNGNTITENLCGGPCERSGFLGVLGALEDDGMAFSRCTAPSGDYTLVTVSSSCSPEYAGRGICISPPNPDGIGNAYINSSPRAYIYKDPLDLLAMIMGGDENNIYGSAAENLFTYKNRLFAERLGLACEVLSQRALLISQNLPDTAESEVCRPLYLEFSNSLKSVSGILSRPDYHETYANAAALAGQLGDAKEGYDALVGRGCEQ